MKQDTTHFLLIMLFSLTIVSFGITFTIYNMKTAVFITFMLGLGLTRFIIIGSDWFSHILYNKKFEKYY